MVRVTGIGGFFFRADDPEALNRWYGEHLGVIMLDSQGYDDPGWFQDRGETVFSAIDPDSSMPGSPERSWAITFRVDDLDGIVERLRGAGRVIDRSRSGSGPGNGVVDGFDSSGTRSSRE